MDLKTIYHKYNRFIQPVLYCTNRLLHFHIHCKGQNNRVIGIGGCRAKNVSISISGSNNEIRIGDMSSLFDVSISIHGSGNIIDLGKRNFLLGASLCIEDDGNQISIGEHTYVYNNTEISAIEETSVSIGKDCLFSGNIMIRSGDSHVIFDQDSRKRINHSKNITIQDHVWLCNGCKILKGASIDQDCVVATGAILTASTQQEANVVLAGSPAKIVRRNIGWSQSRK